MSQVATQDAAAEFMGRASNAQKLQALLHRYPWMSSAAVLLIALTTFSFFNENFQVRADHEWLLRLLSKNKKMV